MYIRFYIFTLQGAQIEAFWRLWRWFGAKRAWAKFMGKSLPGNLAWLYPANSTSFSLLISYPFRSQGGRVKTLAPWFFKNRIDLLVVTNVTRSVSPSQWCSLNWAKWSYKCLGWCVCWSSPAAMVTVHCSSQVGDLRLSGGQWSPGKLSWDSASKRCNGRCMFCCIGLLLAPTGGWFAR